MSAKIDTNNGSGSLGSPRIIQDLTTGSVAGKMLVFAAPLFFSGLLQTLYNTTDIIIVGHVIGKNGLGAVSIGTDILHTLGFAAIGLANAGQVIIAQLVGAGEKERMGKTIGTVFSFMLAAAVIIGIVCGFFLDEILHLVNTPEEAYSYTRDYVSCCLTGLVFIYGYNAVSAILRGMGDSRHPFIFVMISSLLNIALDLLFVVGWKMEVFGAALATVISQGVSFLIAMIFLCRNRSNFYFDFRLKSFRLYGEALSPLLKLGIPMLIQSVAISFSMLFVNSWINSYGVVASAMNGIGNKLNLIVNVTNISLSTAGSSMIGQCIGAEKYERVPRVLAISFVINGIVSVIMGLLVALFPRQVFGIFTHDAEVLDLAVTYVGVALVLFCGSALRPPMISLINGTGNFKLNLAVALLDGVFVRIGLAVLLGLVFSFGVYGFWYGHAIAGTVPFFIGGAYFLTGRWRTRKYILNR